MADDASKRAPVLVTRRLVSCGRCGRADECSPTELLRYTREGWPRCCGQVMALFTEAQTCGTDDTALDRPSLSHGPEGGQ